MVLPSNEEQFEATSPAAQKRGRGGGIGVFIALIVVLVAVIAFAVTGLLGRQTAAPAPGQPAAVATRAPAAAAPTTAANPGATAAPAPAGTPADASTRQAIQDVIKRVDDAQVQAIATGDPKVMADTATQQFYEEQVAGNQDLVDNGVTEIKLLNLEWGDISVNGNTATATVWETWSTTFEDGTTEQARDRNVYTLVLDNGTWKVQEDAHPDQAQEQQQQQAPPQQQPAGR